MFLKASVTSSERNRVVRSLARYRTSDVHHRCLTMAMEALHFAAKGLEYRCDALLRERIQHDIKRWYFRIQPHMHEWLVPDLAAMHGGERFSTERRESWSLQTRGYER